MKEERTKGPEEKSNKVSLSETEIEKNKVRKKVFSLFPLLFLKIKDSLRRTRGFLKGRVVRKVENVLEKGTDFAANGAKRFVKVAGTTADDFIDIATLKLVDDKHETKEKGPIPKLIRVPVPYGTALSVFLGKTIEKIKNYFSRKK